MLEGILAISGHSGLFKLVSNAKNTIIVESLTDGKRMPVYSSSKMSSLEEVAIFTDKEEVELIDVFKNIFKKENGGPTINFKAPAEELKTYFKEVLPNYDQNRVYVSDMKKIFRWYNLLQEKNLLKIEEGDKKPDPDTEKEATKE